VPEEDDDQQRRPASRDALANKSEDSGMPARAASPGAPFVEAKQERNVQMLIIATPASKKLIDWGSDF